MTEQQKKAMTGRLDLDHFARRADRDRDDVVGAEEWYNHLFGAVHTAGGGLARLFGGGALVDQVERLQDPILPDWAKGANKLAPDGAGLQMVQMSKMRAPAAAVKSAPAAPAPAAPAKPARSKPQPPPGGKIAEPDCVVVYRRGSDKPDVISGGVLLAVVDGGKFFEGPGYSGGDWTRGFSFGFESPSRVVVVMKSGASTAIEGVGSVLFCVKPGSAKVAGDDTALGAERKDDMRDYEVLGEQNHSDGDVENPYVLGGDVIGAVQKVASNLRTLARNVKKTGITPRSGVVLNRTPKGTVFTRLKVNPSKLKTNEQVAKNAKDVAKQMKTVAKRALKRVAEAAKREKAKKTLVRGDGYDVLGAPLLPPRPPLSRPPLSRTVKAPLSRTQSAKSAAARKRPKLTLAQVKRMAEDLDKSAGKLESKAADFKARVEAYKKAREAGLTKARAVLDPKKSVKVRGDEVLGQDWTDIVGWEEIVGAEREMAAANFVLEVLGQGYGYMPNAKEPDPLNPGYTFDGTPISEAGYGGGYSDYGGGYSGYGGGYSDYDYGAYGSSEPAGKRTDLLPGPEEEYGAGPKPTLETARALFMDEAEYDKEREGGDAEIYRRMPRGAIPFTMEPMSPPVPYRGITSYSNADPQHTQWRGNVPDGGIDRDASGGPAGAGFFWIGDGHWRVFWPWSIWSEHGAVRNAIPVNPPNVQEAADLDVLFDASINHKWGPLIGKTSDPDWVGLRYLRDGSRKFFWHRDKAPEWAVSPYIEELRDKLLTEWQTIYDEGKAAYVEAASLDLLDEQQAQEDARRRAKEDAEYARRREQEDRELAAQQARFEQEQAQEAMRLEQQYAVDMAKLEQEMMRHQMEMEQQAMAQAAEQQMLLQMAQQGMLPPAYGYGGGYTDPYGGYAPDYGGYADPYGYGGDPFGGYGGGYGQGYVDPSAADPFADVTSDRGFEDRYAADVTLDDLLEDVA